jgi:5-bromo-4-chloroindolyl phosphate hydrolysis protein
VKKIDGEVVKLSFDKTITIDLMEGNTNFIDIYLKRTFKGKRNVLKVTGMNGETITNLDVNF